MVCLPIASFINRFFTKLVGFALLTSTMFYSMQPLHAQLPGKGKKAQEIQDILTKGINSYRKFSRADSLLVYANKALQVSKLSTDKKQAAFVQLQISVAYQAKNELDTSNAILNKIIKDSSGINDKSILGQAYFNLGLNFFRSGQNKLAIENYLLAIHKLQDAKDMDYLALAYCKLAGITVNEKQKTETLGYLSKSKELLLKVKDPFVKLSLYSGITGLYVQLGVGHKPFIDSSIVYAKRALDIVNKYGYYAKGSQLCLSLSDAYYLKSDYKNALEYCLGSLKFRSYLQEGEILMTYLSFSNCYNALKQHDLAIAYLDSVKVIVSALNDPYYEMSYYERVFYYNKDAGRYFEALLGLERFKAIQDSLYNLEKTTAINELIQKYDKVENEKKISELNHLNEVAQFRVKFLLLGIFAAILVIVVIVFFYRQSLFKNKLVILETQLQLDRARINPHFFFNVLSSIKAQAEEEENKANVPNLLTRFSKIMRQSLESTYDELVTLEAEEEFIRNYLTLQQLRYPNKFEFTIQVHEQIAPDEVKLPAMLLQVFIENAIEHGFKNCTHKGLIQISFKLEDDFLHVTCVDNGVGLMSNKSVKSFPSRAVQMVESRLNLLNKKHSAKSSLKIGEVPGGGVSVSLMLPILS